LCLTVLSLDKLIIHETNLNNQKNFSNDMDLPSRVNP
jgi:hypothetical protein